MLQKEVIYEPTSRVDPYQVYNEAFIAFEKEIIFCRAEVFRGRIKFEVVEFAAKSAIMASYCLYGLNFFDEALESISTFIKKYPADKNIIYAHYLVALIYFEQIADEKKDLEPLLKAKEKISFFLKKYPNNDYAIDLSFKKDLIINQIAAKELYVAKYYVSVKKWITLLID